MNKYQWNYFCHFRESFKQQVLEWSKALPQLQELQKQAAKKAGTPDYSFENPLVYNSDLDKISQSSKVQRTGSLLRE